MAERCPNTENGKRCALPDWHSGPHFYLVEEPAPTESQPTPVPDPLIETLREIRDQIKALATRPWPMIVYSPTWGGGVPMPPPASGYSCPVCHGWVLYGTTHLCPGPPTNGYNPPLNVGAAGGG